MTDRAPLNVPLTALPGGRTHTNSREDLIADSLDVVKSARRELEALLAPLVEAARNLDTWQAELQTASNPRVPEDDQKGCSFQARRAARIVTSDDVRRTLENVLSKETVHDLQAAACWTNQVCRDDNVPPELAAAVDGAFQGTQP
jgi:hypothetical protein